MNRSDSQPPGSSEPGTGAPASPNSGPARRDIIVIGASAGGVSALLTLMTTLPRVPAAVLIVLHIGPHRSVLPALLQNRSSNRAIHAEDGQPIEPGTLYIAPPDHHMLVEEGFIRLTRGPKEHHTRPAVDPLFRTAALAYGPRVIGVVLTGRLDDGTAGLQAIKDCGGVAVVQDPAEAEHRSMPLSALKSVPVDRCVPLTSMAETLLQLVDEPIVAAEPPPAVRKRLALEVAVTGNTENPMENLDAIGKPSHVTCPDCSGVLWEISDTRPPRYRCHTGHAFSLRSLCATQDSASEDALWAAIRALQAREVLQRQLAEQNRLAGDVESTTQNEAKADEAARLARQLHILLEQP